MYICVCVCVCVYVYNFYDIWEVKSAKTQYLPTSFSRRVLLLQI